MEIHARHEEDNSINRRLLDDSIDLTGETENTRVTCVNVYSLRYPFKYLKILIGL